MSIILDQLTKRYEGHPVVNRLSLEIANGEFFVLIGPSGSGKSTVLRMIAGLNSVDEGRVILHGRDVTLATDNNAASDLSFNITLCSNICR